MIDGITCSSIKSNPINIIDYVHSKGGSYSPTHSSAIYYKWMMGQLQIRRPSGLDEATFASFDGQDYDSNTLNTNTYKNLKLIQFLTT